MAFRERSASVLRLLPAMLLTPAALLLIMPGCQHRRSALRPVFVGPAAAPATLVPAEPSCPPGSNCPPASVAPGTVSPGFSDDASPASGGSVSPSPGPRARPMPGSSDEPALEPAQGLNESPPAVPPQARRTDLRSGPGRGRQASLQTKLAPFVNDPNDLFLPPKADRAWRYVVLHHSAHAEGGYAQIDRDHRKRLGTAGCGYHFIIGNGTESPDGQIEVAGRWSDQKAGAHCRDARQSEMNDYGIGICLVGDLDKSPPTPKQVEAARALVAYLRDRYSIPPDHVGTHAQIASSSAACPGKHFPVEAIVKTRSLASY